MRLSGRVDFRLGSLGLGIGLGLGGQVSVSGFSSLGTSVSIFLKTRGNRKQNETK